MTTTTTSANPRTERYRQAERALWDRYGLEPTDRFVELDSPAVRLRVLEVGSGEPALFVHGTGGPGAFPSLVSELSGLRCLVLDRPGWGLSSPLEPVRYGESAVTADVLCGVLDALDIERAHVVGTSIGNNWALRLAQRQPARVGRIVLLGGAPLAPGIPVPGFIRLLSSPLGALVVRLPQKPKMVHAQLRQIGHGPSLDAGRIPDEWIQWRLALGRGTDSMHHERAMIRAGVSLRTGPHGGLQLEDGELAAIEQPALWVYGTADPVGTLPTWKRVVGLLPRGELHLVEGGGHAPWFDDPGQVARRINRFLAT